MRREKEGKLENRQTDDEETSRSTTTVTNKREKTSDE